MESRIVKLEQQVAWLEKKHGKFTGVHCTHDKPDCAPCDAHVEEQDEQWQRKYEIADKQLDIARAALQAISHDEKRAGWNLDNSPATKALQKLQGTLIPEEKGGK